MLFGVLFRKSHGFIKHLSFINVMKGLRTSEVNIFFIFDVVYLFANVPMPETTDIVKSKLSGSRWSKWYKSQIV